MNACLLFLQKEIIIRNLISYSLLKKKIKIEKQTVKFKHDNYHNDTSTFFVQYVLIVEVGY